MSTTTEVAAPPRRFPWFPVTALVLCAAALTALWMVPSELLERAIRVFATMAIVGLTYIGLGAWMFTRSRTRGLVFLIVTAVLIGLFVGTVRDFKSDGDVAPSSFRLFFQPSHDDELEANRAAQAREHLETVALAPVSKTDYPEYRGRERDGVVQGPKLARDWKAHPPRQLWKQPVGGGYAGFSVVGKLIVTIEQRREREAVVCYDADTGKERWAHSYEAYFTALGGPGPRATPTIADGLVYSLGAAGRFVCLDLASGQEKWHADILDNNDNIMWGMSGSPLVYDNVVVVNPGAQRDSASLHALIAYDRKTGQQAWAAGNTKAGYCSPKLTTIAGVRQIVLFDGVEIAGYDAATHEKLWHHPWRTHQDINVAQPLILDGDRIFVSSGYTVGGAMLQLQVVNGSWSAKELWRNTYMRSKMSSPVEYQGSLYGLDDGYLVCLDAKDGRRRWKAERFGHGQLLRCDDLLLLLAESGKLVLIEATPESFHELGRFPMLEGRTWNYPALSNGKIYVRNDVEMACFDLRGE